MDRKEQVELHIEEVDGRLTLIDQNGRELFGMRKMQVNLEYDDITEVTVTFLVKKEDGHIAHRFGVK